MANLSPIELKRESTDTPPSEEEKTHLRIVAREILSDVAHLFTQHLLLMQLEVQRSMRFAKLGGTLGILCLILGIAALLNLLRALVYRIASANAWSPAGTEFALGMLQLVLAILCLGIAWSFAKRLKDLPQKLAKQWKEEWQWLRKSL